MPKQRVSSFLLCLAWLLCACAAPLAQLSPTQTAAPLPTATAQPPTPAPTVLPPTASPAPVQPSAAPLPDERRLKPGAAVTITQTRMLNRDSGWGLGRAENDLMERVLFTQDGGLTWADRTPLDAVPAVAGAYLRATFFSHAEKAWVAFSAPEDPAADVPAIIWSTSDAGLSWVQSQPLDLSAIPLEFRLATDLGFSDARYGWLVMHLGAGMSHDYIAVFTTADGGATWQRVLDPNSTYPLMACSKSGLAFTSPASGWLAGDCPGLMTQLFFFHTPDGGSSWSQVELPVPAGQPSDLFAQSGQGCGIRALDYFAQDTLLLTLACTNFDAGTHQSWLYSTHDDGHTWSQQPLPAPFGQIMVRNPDESILVGSENRDGSGGAIYSTTDGGQTWSQQTSATWSGAPDFVDSQNGWVVAKTETETALVRTADGGKTWEKLNPIIAP